ncbi:PREDICTED: protein angel homolog 2-like [Priapulus caudatus]|uniref:Protein angel homolog 2-like n=1 Tax=Priapulus caudatus TaxID=37621 RepID=A0ABM1E5E2_PRICU|nr:PREDICTED: protein angel homolog 2-like [Priapulus caudatus]
MQMDLRYITMAVVLCKAATNLQCPLAVARSSQVRRHLSFCTSDHLTNSIPRNICFAQSRRSGRAQVACPVNDVKVRLPRHVTVSRRVYSRASDPLCRKQQLQELFLIDTEVEIESQMHQHEFALEESANGAETNNATIERKSQCDGENEENEVNPECNTGLKREWHLTALGKKHARVPQCGVEVSIMSYNVLAQQLLIGNSFLYDHCHPNVLKWSFRCRNLLSEITDANPDVLCMQEVQEDHFQEFWEPQLASLGYAAVYKKRTDNSMYDGCATFVKRDKFVIERARVVEFFRAGVVPLSKHNVAVIVALRARADPCMTSDPGVTPGGGARLFVANTHLLFSPTRGDVKLAQLNLLLAEVDRVACSGYDDAGAETYDPVVVTGDFNSLPHSDVYKLTTRGLLQYAGLNCGTISGQENARARLLDAQLLPDCVGVSEQCQYIAVCRQRLMYGCPVATPTPTTTTPADLGHSWSEIDGMWEQPYLQRHLQQQQQQYQQRQQQQQQQQQHLLNLASAYEHRDAGGQPEATTSHGRANCTVDYVFYGVALKELLIDADGNDHSSVVAEGALKLLGRLSLPSDADLDKHGRLPSKFLSSDHVSLVTKFLLTS